MLGNRATKLFGALLILIGVLVGAREADSAPVVSNVRASQRTDGTGMVDIYYDLSGAGPAVVVNLVISNDAGSTFSIIPSPQRLTGDLGSGVANGTDRHIVWDVARDRPEIYWPQCRAQITAAEPGSTIGFTLPGGVTLEMVGIPAGSFVMGSDFDFTGWAHSSNEYPAHTVTIGYSFYIGKFEVTQAQWAAVMLTNPGSPVGANNPVNNVAWNTVQSYLTALNGLGLGGTFRLPTEAEWEYTERGGTQTRFHFGDSNCATSDCTNICDLGLYAWYCQNSGGTIKVVGQKLPNPFGLYDTMGNIGEWVQDTYQGSYTGAPTDGSAWIDMGSNNRVFRGGYWSSSPRNCRPASRTWAAGTTSPGYGVGFRLVWTP